MADPYYANTVLLLPCDGPNDSTVFTDFSSTPKIVTAYGNAKISTAQSKHGGASAYFNGTSDGLMLPDVVLGTGDCTIEMWIKTASSVRYSQLIGNEGSGGFSLLINHASATSGDLALYTPSGLLLTSVSGSWRDDVWHHIALVRSGNTFTLYTDGNANGTGTSTNSLSGSNLWIARNNVYTPRNVIGYFDDLRIDKVARYTGAFTPPGPLLSPISGTILDTNGAPCARTVHLFDRASGTKLGTTVSDASTGQYTLYAPPSGNEVIRIVLADEVTLYNDIIDRILPA